MHPSLGIRSLYANLEELSPSARLLEFDIQQKPADICEALLGCHPKIIGLGVYVWNAVQVRSVVRLVKVVSPETVVVLGGPEVGFSDYDPELVRHADFVLRGEGELEFKSLCNSIFSHARLPEKFISCSSPQLEELALSYSLLTDSDIAHRVVYVETSRGCPFGCEFCLSSLDSEVRRFDLSAVLRELAKLLDRGARHFKFIDRTFNVDRERTHQVLQFFLDRLRPDLLLHFEIVPEIVSDDLISQAAQFPPGTVQFEVGVQTFNAEVAKRIGRPHNFNRLETVLRRLRTETTVHLHADLIVGLPGESTASFAQGFDRLYALNPQEIQVGILKRLRGAPISKHDAEWEMRYSPEPPYELLSSRLIPFSELQSLKRFARYWDLVINNGRLPTTSQLLFRREEGTFSSFAHFSDWLFHTLQTEHGIAFRRLAFALLEYLNKELQLPEIEVKKCLEADGVTEMTSGDERRSLRKAGTKMRQQRHL